MEGTLLTTYTLRVEVPRGDRDADRAVFTLAGNVSSLDGVSTVDFQQGVGRVSAVFAVCGEVACMHALDAAERMLRTFGYRINDGSRSAADVRFS